MNKQKKDADTGTMKETTATNYTRLGFEVDLGTQLKFLDHITATSRWPDVSGVQLDHIEEANKQMQSKYQEL